MWLVFHCVEDKAEILLNIDSATSIMPSKDGGRDIEGSRIYFPLTAYRGQDNEPGLGEAIYVIESFNEIKHIIDVREFNNDVSRGLFK